MLPSPEKFDPIYAAMVGALIAMVSGLVTALVVGFQARQRQKLDLTHSAKQKELERVHSLKREIYLPFSDAMAAAVGFVPTIPTCSIETIRSMQAMTEFGRHYARVSLIAPQQVIQPVMKSFLCLQTVVMALVNKRRAIDDAASELDLNQKATDFLLDRQKKLNARMEALNDTGEPTQKVQLLLQ